jgi:hypothetical protein
MIAFELVLQFRGRQVETEDEVVEIEDVLVELLDHGEALEGHEVGTHARNICVLTSDPRATFERIAPFLARASLIAESVAAFRPLAGRAYTVIWPASHAAFSRT